MIYFYTLLAFILLPTIQGKTSGNFLQHSRTRREETCSQSNQFRCTSGHCIDGKLVCNGRRDCDDGTDETIKNCETNNSAAEFCTLPPDSPDKKFTVECPNNGTCDHEPGKKVPRFTEVRFTCNPEYQSADGKSFISVCSRGTWLPSIVNCSKICKTLKPKNVNLECYLKGEKVDCKGTSVAGTIVRPRCQPLYHEEYPVNYRNITCQADGEWSNTLFACTPECGKTYVRAHRLKRRTLERNGELPWNVAIYDISEKNKPLICGGTIISPQLIISAAHCFFDELNQTAQTPDKYEIAVSKYSRNYATRDNSLTKYYKIRKIFFSPLDFLGASTNYAADIAIIQLTEKISLHEEILPACIRWTDKEFIKVENTSGKIVGWREEENGKLAEISKSENLSFLSYVKCLKTINIDFRQSLTLDKFCAESKTGTKIGIGYGGSGLVFRDAKTDVYYLRGITSVRDPQETSITLFTDVTHYTDWIRDIKNQVENETLD